MWKSWFLIGCLDVCAQQAAPFGVVALRDRAAPTALGRIPEQELARHQCSGGALGLRYTAYRGGAVARLGVAASAP